MHNKDNKTVIAVTMGDPAASGGDMRGCVNGSRHVCFCDRGREDRKSGIGKKLIGDPCRGLYGVIHLVESVMMKNRWFWSGAELAGTSYDWIRKSIELGLAGKVDGVATCPINKQAIKLAGIKQAGHTEIYQELTGSPYALTMFSCHRLRVFFLSRHMSLVDACRYVTKDNTLEMLVLVDKELRRIGHAPSDRGGRAQPAWQRRRSVRP